MTEDERPESPAGPSDGSITARLRQLLERVGRRRLLIFGAIVLGVALVAAALPGSLEVKLVLGSLAVITIVTTWFRIRHALGAREAAAQELPVACAVSWRERAFDVRDDRFPAGGFGGSSGVLRIDETAISWAAYSLPVGEIETALVLTPRDWTQRSTDRTVLRVRSTQGVYDFYLAQPWILDRPLPFPLIRRAAPTELRPMRMAAYAFVLLGLLAVVLLVGPLAPGPSGAPTLLGGPERYAGPVVQLSYPRDGWSLSEETSGGESSVDLELRLDGPEGRTFELRTYASDATVAEAAQSEVDAAVASDCLLGPWLPAYGSLRGAGAVLICGQGEEIHRRRLFFHSASPGRLLRLVERHPGSVQEAISPATEDYGFAMIERSLRVSETLREASPETDLPTTDLPTTDLPTTDLPMTDLPETDPSETESPAETTTEPTAEPGSTPPE